MIPTIYSNVMLDLETMGDGPSAAIVAIGAVAFNIEHAEISIDGFYSRVNLESAVKHGGIMNPATVMWWLQQSDDARHEIARGDGLHIIDALDAFRYWMRAASGCEESNGGDLHVWGNGANFDNVILRSAYHNHGGEPAPWHWRNDRCYRTLKALHRDVKVERIGRHHNAIADAETQALHLLRILRPEFRDAPSTFAFPHGPLMT